MSFMQELTSWTYGGVNVDVKAVPEPGQQAPSNNVLKFPRQGGKPAVVSFMRHCGCPCLYHTSSSTKVVSTRTPFPIPLVSQLILPVAERDFLSLRAFAASNPGIACIAISHSSSSHTETWLKEVGGAGNIELLIDDSRQTHADWGLGPSGWTHVLSYSSFSSLYSLGKEKGIWNRPTETGSRWQSGGAFAVDASGVVRWVWVPEGAQEEPEWGEGKATL